MITGHVAGRMVTLPLVLAGEVLQTLLLDGSLCLDALGPASVVRLLGSLLAAVPPGRGLAFAACTLWALAQVLLPPCFPGCSLAARPLRVCCDHRV